MTKRVSALVVAGGTREPIDDVRIVTNLSKGNFGLAICKALSRRGASVALAASTGVEEHLSPARGADARYGWLVRFSTFADLDRVLRAEAKRYELESVGSPIVFMAAAVSDFSPKPSEGKISSDQDEITLTMRRNPKLIAGFRELFGRGAFLVGFKLTSGLPREAMIAKARKQLKDCRLNLVVANDGRRIGGGRHPVTLVTPEGGAIDLDGTRQEVADALVDFVLKRADVRWSRSEKIGQVSDVINAPSELASLLAFAQDAKLLTGVDGNVSLRDGACLWVTPRQLDKSKLDRDALIRVHPSEDGFRMDYRAAGGDLKPSIDSSVHAWLYRKMPGLKAMLHFHEALVLEDVTTGFPYPCGCREEAEEIHAALTRAADHGRIDAARGFAVKMADHGYLLGFAEGQAQALDDRWQKAKGFYLGHLRDIGEADRAGELDLRPIFVSLRIAGVEARHREGNWSSIFLFPNARKLGVGEEVIKRLIKGRRFIGAHDHCGVADFYLDRGYAIVRSEGKLHVLQPPTLRTDLRESATVCLYNPLTRKVLLGERKTGAWPGYWCCPGGQLEQGQTAEEAALEEFRTETGIDLEGLRPSSISVRYAAFDRGRRGFRIVNFQIPTLDETEPVETDELKPAWMPIDAAATLKPMGPATRAVLRDLKRRLGPR